MTIATDRPRRSALHLPASNDRAIAKARTLPCDVVIIDLEDAVAPEAKVEARAAAVAAVAEGGFGKRELVIRVNGLDTPWGADDLAAMAALKGGLDAVLIPKVSDPATIDACQAALKGAPGSLQLWAMIETCASILSLEAIAKKAHDTRLSLWIVGLNDLAKDMRAQMVPGRTPFLPLLSSVVVAARAHGIAVLDGVCNEFRDLPLFEAEARQGRMFGFDGKGLIHPAQIEIANAAFSPDEAEIAWALAVVDAFAQPENKGKGAIRVEGKMAELLHLDDAHRLLAFAERIQNM